MQFHNSCIRGGGTHPPVASGTMWNMKGVCKVCRRKKNNLSWKGWCEECAMNKVKAVNAQLKAHHGYYWNKYRKGQRNYAKELLGYAPDD